MVIAKKLVILKVGGCMAEGTVDGINEAAWILCREDLRYGSEFLIYDER